jgi:hypothetical protein
MKTPLASDIDRCREILAAMGQIPVIVPGRLSPRRNREGKVTGHKLQCWHNGRNETRHVPAALVPRLEAGAAGYRRFMELAREYVEVRMRQALDRDAADEAAKKSPRRGNRLGPGAARFSCA